MYSRGTREATPGEGAEKVRELRTLKWTVALYIFVFTIKLGAYMVTGVIALLAEAFHTLSPPR
jgi:divalent metal cation (Fe/Co/Zn/Cd) transporter